MMLCVCVYQTISVRVYQCMCVCMWQEFTKRHPEVVILDPLENLYKLLDRHVQYKFVQECDIVEEGRWSLPRREFSKLPVIVFLLHIYFLGSSVEKVKKMFK